MNSATIQYKYLLIQSLKGAIPEHAKTRILRKNSKLCTGSDAKKPLFQEQL
jgi:hypothetical protein